MAAAHNTLDVSTRETSLLESLAVHRFSGWVLWTVVNGRIEAVELLSAEATRKVKLMPSSPSSQGVGDARELIRCTRCTLEQFRSSSGTCRRCFVKLPKAVVA